MNWPSSRRLPQKKVDHNPCQAGTVWPANNPIVSNYPAQDTYTGKSTASPAYKLAKANPTIDLGENSTAPNKETTVWEVTYEKMDATCTAQHTAYILSEL